jgi:hypothetical protein
MESFRRKAVQVQYFFPASALNRINDPGRRHNARCSKNQKHLFVPKSFSIAPASELELSANSPEQVVDSIGT